MSAALIQKCNKCSKPFVKLLGCNKMTCNCGNLQCYVCGESIKDYRHFEVVRKDGSKCPLHENTDQRLETKIKNAQEVAVKKVLEERDDLNEDDLKVDKSSTGQQSQGVFGIPHISANWIPHINGNQWGFQVFHTPI
jgi:E3 ubiquitin-protein ligase RNF216